MRKAHFNPSTRSIMSCPVSPRNFWTPSKTIEFINIVGDNYDNLQSKCKKDVFATIAAQMNSANDAAADPLELVLTSKICTEKWKSLLRQYKVVKNNNSKSGNGRQTWTYFEEIDVFMCRSADICAPAAMNTESPVRRTTEHNPLEEEDEEETTPRPVPPPKRRRRAVPTPQVMTIRKDMYRKRKLELMESMVAQREEMSSMFRDYLSVKKRRLE